MRRVTTLIIRPRAAVIARHQGFLAVVAAILATLAVADLVWWLAGDAYVARAVARGHRATLQFIIPTWVFESEASYLAAARSLVFRLNLYVVGLILLLVPGEFLQGPLGMLYDRILRAADVALAHRHAALAGLAVLVAASAAALAVFVFQRFPNSGDEYCYLYQVETWRAGRAWNPSLPLQPFFRFDHIRVLDGRVFSVFPPGWPAIIFGMGLLGLPAWLVNPALAALAVPAFFLTARRLYDGRTAILATPVLAGSCFFLFNAASYYAHTFTLLAVVLMVCALLEAFARRSAGWAVVAGFAFGGAFGARFFTAGMALLPLVCLFPWRDRRAWRLVPGLALGALPWIGGFLWHHHALMATWFTLPMTGFEAYDRRWFPPDLFSRGARVAALNLLQFTYWTPAALLPLYVIAMAQRPVDPRRFAAGAIFACLVAGYFFYVDDAGNRYGPRYYFEGLPWVILPAVALVFQNAEWRAMNQAGRWRFHLLLVSVVMSLPLGLTQARGVRDTIWERRDLYRLVDAQGVRNAVVFVSTPTGTRARMDPITLTRNGLGDGAAVLYLLDLPGQEARVFEAYPARAFYRYHYDVRARAGALDRVMPPSPPTPLR
jgi:hypothetical protein